MFDLTQISSFMVPSIVILCLCVGYIVKNLIPSEAVDRFIPLIVAVVGLVAAIATSVASGAAITVDVVVAGLVSGLSSTGINQAFKQLLESGGLVKQEASE